MCPNFYDRRAVRVGIGYIVATGKPGLGLLIFSPEGKNAHSGGIAFLLTVRQ